MATSSIEQQNNAQHHPETHTGVPVVDDFGVEELAVPQLILEQPEVDTKNGIPDVLALMQGSRPFDPTKDITPLNNERTNFALSLLSGPKPFDPMEIEPIDNPLTTALLGSLASKSFDPTKLFEAEPDEDFDYVYLPKMLADVLKDPFDPTTVAFYRRRRFGTPEMSEVAERYKTAREEQIADAQIEALESDIKAEEESYLSRKINDVKAYIAELPQDIETRIIRPMRSFFADTTDSKVSPRTLKQKATREINLGEDPDGIYYEDCNVTCVIESIGPDGKLVDPRFARDFKVTSIFTPNDPNSQTPPKEVEIFGISQARKILETSVDSLSADDLEDLDEEIERLVVDGVQDLEDLLHRLETALSDQELNPHIAPIGSKTT